MKISGRLSRIWFPVVLLHGLYQIILMIRSVVLADRSHDDGSNGDSDNTPQCQTV